VDAETAAALRGQAVRGVVIAVRDGTMVQGLTVETHQGVVRVVEVMQQFGISSVPPAGGVAVLLALGGDQGDMVALPAGCPSARMGGLAPGEVVIHDADGNRIHLRAGGTIEVQANTKVTVTAPEVEITGNVRIVGDLVVTGQISDAAGSMQEMRGHYNAHAHPTGTPPNPQMT
jgi:phage gp45-like